MRGVGAIGVESKSIKAENAPIIEDKVIAYACICKSFFTWSSSQSLKRNCQKHTLVSLCRSNPSRRGRERHHWRNNKNKCYATTSNGSHPTQSRGRPKKNYTSCQGTKRMRVYRCGQGRPKRKLFTRSNTKIQAQVVGGKKGPKRR